MTCEVVRDLIPMYNDGTCSEESAKQIKSHIDGCEDCRRYCDACRRAEKKAQGFSKKNLEQAVREMGADISQLDQQYATLSRKLKLRKVRQTLISVFVIAGMVLYITIDIINTLKRKEKN